MKPLSETELREKLAQIIERHNGINPPVYDDEIAEHLSLILQDRKAWGEQLLLDQLKIVTEHPEDGCVWGVKEVGKRAIECYEYLKRQRNQGEKTDE